MKAKLSVTIDEALVSFVDGVPGQSRSEKIESILRRCRDALRDVQLRKELAAFNASDDGSAEDAAWRQVMETAAWNESAEATSGRLAPLVPEAASGANHLDRSDQRPPSGRTRGADHDHPGAAAGSVA
jgi:hypothetical protein